MILKELEGGRLFFHKVDQHPEQVLCHTRVSRIRKRNTSSIATLHRVIE